MAAADDLKDARNSLGGILSAIHSFEDGVSMSLTQYARRSMINSRVYIDKTIEGEEVLTPLMQNLMNMYVGFVLTAMSMNQYVTHCKRVRDIMSVVSTESLVYAEDSFKKYFAGMEDLIDELIDNDLGDSAATDSKIVDPETRSQVALPSGRIIKVNFQVGAAKMNIDLFMQLTPTIVPPDVARQFMSLNFSPSFRQRWMQASAGEIRTVADLFLGMDLRRKRLNAMKHDKSGVLQDMLDRQQNNLSSAWLKLGQFTPDRQNIANTILIYDKTNFSKACSEAGFKFDNYNVRQKFFNKTFSLMVCTVDPMYNKITVYYHGLPTTSTFTFEQMKKNAKVESTDILSMMKNYAQGMAPKF